MKVANRYHAADDPDIDDDDFDMEEWMDMSDEERERELEASSRQLLEALSRLTPAQLYAHRRRSLLAQCIDWRGHIRNGFVTDITKNFLHRTQVNMVKLRVMRATGTYPGEA